MYIELIAGGYLVADFFYHRFTDKPDFVGHPSDFSVPRTEAGTAIPIIFGRVRQTQPVLAWAAITNVFLGETYARYFFICGIAVDDGNGTSQIRAWYLGDERTPREPWLSEIISTPGVLGADLVYTGTPPSTFVVGDFTFVEQLRGGPTQVLANVGEDETNAVTLAGREMIRWGCPVASISGYRGYLSAFIGSISSATPQALSFEVSSYPSTGYPAPYPQVGMDMNPVDAIWCLLKSKHGKLGIDTARLDFASFQACATTLHQESHGYSGALTAAEGAQHIGAILEQIDGVLRENPVTGLLECKLIRNDYDPATVFHLTKDNCSEIQNLAIGGWQGIPNKIRVTFPNRNDGYRDGSAIAHNQANAVGQDGVVREMTIRYEGVRYQSLADSLAARELAARSRPITKLRIIGDATLRNLMVGDAVKLTWTDPDISGQIFRIANADRGTLAKGQVALDLISDYYYVWRGQAPLPPALGGVRVDLGIHIVMG